MSCKFLKAVHVVACSRIFICSGSNGPSFYLKLVWSKNILESGGGGCNFQLNRHKLGAWGGISRLAYGHNGNTRGCIRLRR